jgi:hypothetical protein
MATVIIAVSLSEFQHNPNPVVSIEAQAKKAFEMGQHAD